MKKTVLLILFAFAALAGIEYFLLRPGMDTVPEPKPVFCDQTSNWRKCFETLYAGQEARKAFTYPVEAFPDRDKTERYLRITWTLRNLMDRPAPELRFWSYLPPQEFPGQVLRTVQLSRPAGIAVDSLGNRILHTAWNGIAPFETVIYRQLIGVTRFRPPSLPEKTPPPLYLAPDHLTQSDHPKIRRAAEGLKQNTPDKTAARIFHFVRTQLAPEGYDGRDYGALWALENRKGDCTEMALLFTALCRACGLPARVLAGFVAERDRVVHASDFHNWAQYFDGTRWHSADPYYGELNQSAQDYVVLEIFQPTRRNPVEAYHLYRFDAGTSRFKVSY